MKNFQSFITEENVNDGDIQIAVLTKTSSNKEEVVANQLKKYSDKNNISCHIVNTREAWVSDNDLEKGILTISNIQDERIDFEDRIYHLYNDLQDRMDEIEEENKS